MRVRLARGIEFAQTPHQTFVALVLDAVDRAGLPVARGAGPRSRIKATPGPQLPLGFTSLCEYIDFALAAACTACRFAAELAPQLPDGVRLLWSGRIPSRTQHLRGSVLAYWYTLFASLDAARAGAFFAAAEWPYAREKRDQTIQLDLKTHVDRIDVRASQSLLKIRTGTGPQIRPQEVLESVFDIPRDEASRVPVERTALILSPAPFPRSFLVE